ncbi:MAG: hypothetical protein ACI80V_003315 [Rhodothermales bacterium]|jgi:hypothetical protein
MTRLAAVGLLIGLAGCAASRRVPVVPPSEGFPHHSLDEVIARLPTPDSLWGSFSGDMAVAYSMPGDRGTLNARISYRRADSVLIRFRAPLGIEVSRALVTADSMFVFDRLKKTLYFGLREVADDMLPVGFWRSDVAASVFGYDDLSGESWDMEADSSFYTLTSRDGLRSVIVDPGRWRIVASDLRDSAGMIVERRRFTDFEQIDGLYVPRRIVTSRLDKDVRASISIRRITPQPDDLSFDLGLRSDTQRIPVY